MAPAFDTNVLVESGLLVSTVVFKALKVEVAKTSNLHSLSDMSAPNPPLCVVSSCCLIQSFKLMSDIVRFVVSNLDTVPSYSAARLALARLPLSVMLVICFVFN